VARFISRRRFLGIAGLSGLGLAAYSYQRGVRIPPLVWEPRSVSNQVRSQNIEAIMSDLIPTHTQVIANADLSFRAYAPEPSLQLQLVPRGQGDRDTLRISVNNVAPSAVLDVTSGSVNHISESIQGITRVVEVSLSELEVIALKWELPAMDSFHFASIGDTGGQHELDWCIQRAHQLGASFLLHLGDFDYTEGDYDNAVKLFNHAPLPCYVSIGNHDFHQDGPIYQQFLNDIGPLNNAFSIANTHFVNLDTAANTLPYHAGHRGRLLNELSARYSTAESNIGSTIVFTHRPLFDPEENSDHDLGNPRERDWLIDQLHSIGTSTLLSGHIHIRARETFKGIDNIIVGQGLGHQDLIVNDINYSKMALGHVSSNGDVEFEFAPLAMPFHLHCHPRTEYVKASLRDAGQSELIKQVDAACSAKPPVE